jgi:hypothetical protein
MKTLFNVYDRVWLMRNNKPTEMIVIAVIQSMSSDRQNVDTGYRLVESQVGAGWENNEGVEYPIDKVFRTKKELIDSL